MRLVKWSNGTYSLRKFSFLHMRWVYKDLVSHPYWWPKYSTYFRDCVTNSLEELNKKCPSVEETKKWKL